MLSKDKIDALRKPFPSEALSEDRSRGFKLTSIKAAYIIERLNDVFGPCGIGWRYDHSPVTIESVRNKEEVVTEVALQYRYDASEWVGTNPVYWRDGYGWEYERGNNDWSYPIFAHGGKSLGGGAAPYTDARKSAVTDGLTKAASMIGIGHDVFKGRGERAATVVKRKEPKGPPEDVKDLQTAEFMLTPEDCKEKGLDISGYAHYVLNLLKGVEHNGDKYYSHEKHRKNLYALLFGEETLGEAVLGWFRLLERYALYLNEAEDFEEAKAYAQKVVKTGVENQVDWDGAVEVLDES